MRASDPTPPSARDFRVYEVRHSRVTLDADVARAFGLETKRINEAVARNPAKFNEAHVFQLTEEEASALRSQLATSKAGRGGRRYLPYIFTAKGVARLATVLNTDQALRATDLIIDVFLAVQQQVSRGANVVSVDSERLDPPNDDGLAKGLRDKLARAVSALLDTVIDVRRQQTVRQVAADLSSGALNNLRERLRTKGLENAKLEADAMLVLAQAEKVYAETRKQNAEAESQELDNIPKRIAALRELITLYRDAGQPTQIVRLLSHMEQFEQDEAQSAARQRGPGT